MDWFRLSWKRLRNTDCSGLNFFVFISFLIIDLFDWKLNFFYPFPKFLTLSDKIYRIIHSMEMAMCPFFDLRWLQMTLKVQFLILVNLSVDWHLKSESHSKFFVSLLWVPQSSFLHNPEHPKGYCSTVNHVQFYKNGVLHTGYSSKVNFDEKLDGNWGTLSSQDDIFYRQFRNEIIKGLFKRYILQLIDFILYKFIYK